MTEWKAKSSRLNKGRKPRKLSSRTLTNAEISLSQSVFGEAIDYSRVRICDHKWIFFQPSHVVMAPMGHIHFHPKGNSYSPDFGLASLDRQALFIHEMVHVWQHQKGVFLPVKRHLFCRYDYSFKPGLTFSKYGIEQQAELVRHAFLLRENVKVPGAPALETYRSLLPFPV